MPSSVTPPDTLVVAASSLKFQVSMTCHAPADGLAGTGAYVAEEHVSDSANCNW